MKFVRYQDGAGQARYGVLDGETVHAADGDPFAGGLTAGSAVGALGELTLLPPVQPGKIVCVGLNYAAHVTETDATRAVPEEPVLFMKPPSALVGHGAPIAIANPDNRTDHEAELAVVIGRRARGVAAASAADYILGYTAGNDVSDRPLQQKDGQWVRAKGFDTYCPLGPCVATDLDPTAGDGLAVVSRLNGETKQSSTTRDMIFDVPALIAYISGIMTLEPGDVIMTGTPEGVGPMRPGDTIEVEVGGVGVLRNPVTAR
ncbi:MAG: Fumarylacetoacetate hydrolase family protein [uncultured Thermomicrobiales bacterium]|uniref:Fumarylacetoacetate hydrolase family protein n=1 Tax=uncultured Thermomicrobiales bacterium TaxID=1645740 RepID=A0A6J4UQW2_9BACT|nr:MAG: Fumarylacetoacetate hydrolase family protein [uncultured Thermomicrobiales bacterium]